MYSGSSMFRVVNVCKYGIGVRKADGTGFNIPADGGMIIMSMNDILYDESRAKFNCKKFAKGMLEIYDAESGKKVSISELGMQEVPEEAKHLTEDEIYANLKGNLKKLESWLNKIDDEAELHAIYTLAVDMDLPVSKLKILKAKMPEKNFNIE